MFQGSRRKDDSQAVASKLIGKQAAEEAARQKQTCKSWRADTYMPVKDVPFPDLPIMVNRCVFCQSWSRGP